MISRKEGGCETVDDSFIACKKSPGGPRLLGGRRR